MASACYVGLSLCHKDYIAASIAFDLPLRTATTNSKHLSYTTNYHCSFTCCSCCQAVSAVSTFPKLIALLRHSNETVRQNGKGTVRSCGGKGLGAAVLGASRHFSASQRRLYARHQESRTSSSKPGRLNSKPLCCPGTRALSSPAQSHIGWRRSRP